MLPPSSCTKIAEISWNFYASTRPLGRSSNTSASRWYYHKFSIWVTCTLCWEFVQLDGNSVYKGGRGDSLSEMGSRNRCPFPVLLSRVLLIRALSPPPPPPFPCPCPRPNRLPIHFSQRICWLSPATKSITSLDRKLAFSIRVTMYWNRCNELHRLETTPHELGTLWYIVMTFVWEDEFSKAFNVPVYNWF